ncbi:MAG TPA: hypothetical protein VHP83_18115 [Aggregatilineaceae bacterium]|nr:hypothetical protein [Aggregatilineaceae bacterium]
MLEDKRVLYGLILGGLILALLSVLIDPIRGHDIYMAPVQIIGVIVGLVVFAAGVYLAFMRKPAV